MSLLLPTGKAMHAATGTNLKCLQRFTKTVLDHWDTQHSQQPQKNRTTVVKRSLWLNCVLMCGSKSNSKPSVKNSTQYTGNIEYPLPLLLCNHLVWPQTSQLPTA